MTSQPRHENVAPPDVHAEHSMEPAIADPLRWLAAWEAGAAIQRLRARVNRGFLLCDPREWEVANDEFATFCLAACQLEQDSGRRDEWRSLGPRYPVEVYECHVDQLRGVAAEAAASEQTGTSRRQAIATAYALAVLPYQSEIHDDAMRLEQALDSRELGVFRLAAFVLRPQFNEVPEADLQPPIQVDPPDLPVAPDGWDAPPRPLPPESLLPHAALDSVDRHLPSQWLQHITCEMRHLGIAAHFNESEVANDVATAVNHVFAALRAALGGDSAGTTTAVELDEPATEDDESVEIDGVRFEFTGSTLRNVDTGDEVTLCRGLEQNLFKSLLRHRGESVKRERLESAWPRSTESHSPRPSGGAMDTALYRLRQKLQAVHLDLDNQRELGWRLVRFDTPS